MKDTYFQSFKSKTNDGFEKPEIILKDKFYQMQKRRTSATKLDRIEKITGKMGKYEIIEELGSGQYFKVKLAKDIKNNRDVAIKLMKKDVDPEAKEQIMNEVAAFKKIKFHKHIIEIYENGVSQY